MKITLSKEQFISKFREIRPDNFSYEALATLYDYYEELENDGEMEIEFDPIAFSCEWTEYDFFQLIKNYAHLYKSDHVQELETLDEKIEFLNGFIDHLGTYTTIIQLTDTFLVLEFLV